MTQEEKARAYDEAIKKVNDYYEGKTKLYSDIDKTLNYLFPELKESEDERMSKYLIKYFEANKDELSKGFKWNGITVEECIAWLKKQGEHANFRNKIQVGDKVTRNKDGVLVNLSQLNRVAKKDNKQPTNEEMKELLQTEYEKGRADAIAEMQLVWSEEDEVKLINIINFFDSSSTAKLCPTRRNEAIAWLKSLKGRIQQNPKWNEEDSIRLQRIIDFLWYNRKGDTDTIYQQEQDIEWLKSLKEKV